MRDLGELEALYLDERGKWDEEFRIRVHRAISWLKASEKYADSDIDMSFLGAMNATNACWSDNKGKDRDGITDMVGLLRGTDSLKQIHKLVMNSGEGKEWSVMLINNEHLYAEYVEYLRGKASEHEYKERIRKNQESALWALKNHKFDQILTRCLSQCVSLRSQVAHGFSTYESSANRRPLELTASMLRKITLHIIHEMIKSPKKNWGETPWLYPNEKYEGAFSHD